MSNSLISENVDVKDLKNILEKFNWENGENYGLTKHLFLNDYIYDLIFDKKFNELNKNYLEDLTEIEKRDVVDYVKNILKSVSEDKLLDYLKYGIEYTVKRREKRTYRLIDFVNVENNSMVYGNEIKFPGSPENIKPDFTLFINGIPIVIIEAKRSTKLESEEEAIAQIRRYEQEGPELFRFVQFAIAYGEKKLFLPTYPNWHKELRVIPAQPWKIEKLDSETNIKIESIEQLFQHEVLLNVIEWFTFFREKGGKKDKIIERYNQYIATEKAIKRVDEYLSGKSQLERGLIWHWQGNGKTYTMFFIANKYFEKYYHLNPLVFFIVDRIDLQRQLIEFLERLNASKFKNYIKIIENIEQLKNEITTIKRSEYNNNIITKGVYVVLIQKFKKQDFENLLLELGKEVLEHLKKTNQEEYEKIQNELKEGSQDNVKKKLIELGGIQKKEILLLIDEAHRSQYGLLASMMKNVFKKAMRFAFTGTPVFKFEKNTFREFANPPEEYYLDVYFIKDSIEDNFTLPIVYDVIQEGTPVSDGVKILLNDEDIKKYIEYWLDISQEGSSADDVETIMETEKIEDIQQSQNILITKNEILQHLTKVKVFLTNKKRLQKLASFIAHRIKEDTENFQFKAMIVTANREACVHMKKFLDEELQKIYSNEYGEDVKRWVEIVMTYQQNDLGAILDYKNEIIARRGKNDLNEINADIQREFKEEDNPKILIVTDMLITGFDAPKLKVMYLDKPLYEHRLLQAIARVNRPFKDEITEKKYGLIVDSVGLLREVKETLKKFELIADKKIEKDIEENILGEIESRFKEFEDNLNEIKQKLENLKINDRDLSININKIKEEIKNNKVEALEKLKTEIEPKLQLIAGFWNSPEVPILLNRMKEVIEQFRALGSHRGKIIYADDLELLSYIYGKILFYIKGKRVPKEFWDGLIEIINEKTLVDDFRTIIRTEINNEILINNISILNEKISAKEIIQEKDIITAYRILRNLLEADIENPVYRAIYERIEEAREEWTTRNIDTSIFISIISESAKEKIEYDEKIAKKDVIERITDTINLLLSEMLGNKISLELNELKETISKIIKAPKIVPSHENEIRTALLKDLFRELKNVDLTKRKDFAETITREYIMDELEKTKTKRRNAS